MSDTSQKNKRIVKNTFFLYVRTFAGLIVALLTARVVFNTLGVVDYGLNNVVGGILGLIAFVNNALSASTSRYLAYEQEKGNLQEIKKTYTSAFAIHLAFASMVVVFGETIGLYLLNYLMVIPADRLFACNVLYQTCIFNTFITLSQVQNSALIIAFEKMDIYAYLGVCDIVAKCLIVFLVPISPYDKLITLALLTLGVSLSISIWQMCYCKVKFKEIYSWSLRVDKSIVKSMLGFSSWSLLGSIASMSRTLGLNFLLNLFFGPAANAANAIAYRVNASIVQFTGNFTTATNPQITKLYAVGEMENMKKLVFRSGKFTFYLLMLLCFPVIFEIEYILKLWMGDDVPELSFIMTQLVLIISMVETFTFSMGCAIQATAKVRNYQIVISGILLSILPLSYIAFKLGAPEYYGLIVYLAISILGLFGRLYFVRKLLGFTAGDYIKNVFLHTITVALICLIVPYVIVSSMESSFIRFLLVVIASEMTNCLGIWYLGMDTNEKAFIKKTMNALVVKTFRKFKKED